MLKMSTQIGPKDDDCHTDSNATCATKHEWKTEEVRIFHLNS